MANNVAPPRNGIPIGTVRVGGQTVSVDVHPEYLRWFENLVFRIGGATGPTATDLAASSFEDAGIEESKIEIFRISDDVGQVPPQQLHQLTDDAAQVPPAQAHQLDDSAWQFPAPLQVEIADDDVSPGIEDLRAQVAELTKAVKALQQGMTA